MRRWLRTQASRYTTCHAIDSPRRASLPRRALLRGLRPCIAVL